MKNELTNYDYDGGFFSPLFDFFAPEEIRNPKYARSLAMKTDIKSDEKNYTMEVELPGIKKDDISVSLKNGYLTVKAVVKHEDEEKEKKNSNYLHRERFYGTSSRTYYVGDIDEKSVEANFTDGLLTLTFPKEKEKVEEDHRISIK